MNAYLIRQYFDTHTFGTLFVGGKVFYTLERPWQQNHRNVSCIPPGSYQVAFLPRSGSGKYRNCWHLTSVPNRAGILIHNGNLVAHTRGCLLLGTHHGRLAGKPAVLASRTAMRQMLNTTGKEGFELMIYGETPDGMVSSSR